MDDLEAGWPEDLDLLGKLTLNNILKIGKIYNTPLKTLKKPISKPNIHSNKKKHNNVFNQSFVYFLICIHFLHIQILTHTDVHYMS